MIAIRSTISREGVTGLLFDVSFRSALQKRQWPGQARPSEKPWRSQTESEIASRPFGVSTTRMFTT
jgi:hypothetical protein